MDSEMPYFLVWSLCIKRLVHLASGVSSGGLRELEHPPTLPDCTEIIPICASISFNLLLFLFDDSNILNNTVICQM